MRKRKTYLLLSLVFTLGLLAFRSPAIRFTPPEPMPVPHLAEVDPCSTNNTAFQIGEEFVFRLYYNWNFVWLKAGEVKFKVEDQGDMYHLSAYGRTYSSYEWFYTVRDKYDTYINKETLLPVLSIRNIQEGGYRLYDKIEFDQEGRVAKSTRGKTIAETKVKEFQLDNCMHDILSIVYHARNIDFAAYEPGQAFPIEVFVDNKSWPLQVRYKGKTNKKHVRKLGHFKALRFTPDVSDAGTVFSDGDEMNVWVSDDKNRLPLLIESPVSVGSVKAVLKSYSGLKHEMSSKLE